MKKISITTIVLVIIGALLIFYAFKRTDKSNELMNYIKNNTIEVKDAKLDEKNNDKLVLVNGIISSSEELTDTDFGIKVKTSKLKRKVEMYQWDICDDSEEEKEECEYKKVWSEKIIDSKDFKKDYKNPTEMPYESKVFYSTKSKLGEYTLNELVLNKLKYNETVSNEQITSQLNYIEGYDVSENYITSYEAGKYVKIGDIRISYEYASDKEITVLATQKNDTFKEFRANDKKYIYVYEKEYEKEDILDDVKRSGNFSKVIFIGFGIIAIIIGINASRNKKEA